jgi:NAD(P)H-hydrate epimerase
MREYLRENSENYVLLSREEVREFDKWAINKLGIPGVILMENAGRSCAEYIIDHFTARDGAKVCIFCGTGNNGGDGYVIARHLFNAGFEVKVVICGERVKVRGDALINLEIIEGLKIPILDLDMTAEKISEQVEKITFGRNMIVDALFGTGLRGELRTEYAQLITCLNACKCPILAVDIPSGLDCNMGLPLPVCVEAEATITFAAVKKAFVSAETAQATGRVFVASIGIEPTAYLSD